MSESEKESGAPASRICDRFRGFLPVVVDVETGGFNAKRDALLEIAAVLLHIDADGQWVLGETYSTHVTPFEGANIEPAALEVTGIDPDHPLRLAVDERTALKHIFDPIRSAVKSENCSRAVLVGHNPAFDIGFVNAAVERTGFKRNPFHPFATFDTATLGGLAFGQTVLSKAVQAAGFPWDSGGAHSAVYDAQMTAKLFCRIVNLWGPLGSAKARVE